MTTQAEGTAEGAHSRLHRPSFRRSVPSAAALVVLAALAWIVTAQQAGGMGVGPGTMGLTLPLFLLTWVVMMAAMMFPSVAPVAILWTKSIAATTSGRRRAVRMSGFVGGYLVAWTGFGLLAYIALIGMNHLATSSPRAATWLGSSIFLAAGIYQLTPLKQACLRHCRAPVMAFLNYASLKGAARNLRVGVHHGVYCVGCCWGLMVVLLAVGVMNLVAMAALAVVIFLEKIWREGPAFSKVVGVAFIVIAGLIPFYPWLLPGLHVAPALAPSMGGM